MSLKTVLVVVTTVVGGTVSGIAAATSPFLAGLTISFAVLIAMTWRRPEVPVLAVAALVPSGHFARSLRLDVGGSYLTALQVTVFALAALTLTIRFNRGAMTRPAAQVGVGIAVVGTVAAAGSDHPLASLYWVANLGGLLVALSVVLHDRVRCDQRAVHRFVVGLGLVIAVVCIVEGVRGEALLGSYYVENVANFTSGGVGFRPVATVANPLVASTALVGIFALALVSEHIRWRSVVVAVLGAAICVSLSRSSIILMVAVAVAYVAFGFAETAQTRRRRSVMLLGIPLSLAGVYSVYPALQSRLSASSRLLDDPARVASVKRALALWIERNPLTGLGFGGYKRYAMAEVSAAHATSTTVDNMYISLLVDSGIVGATAVIVCCVMVAARRQPGGASLPLLAILAAGMFLEPAHHDLTVTLGAVFLIDWWCGDRQRVQETTRIHATEDATSRVGA